MSVRRFSWLKVFVSALLVGMITMFLSFSDLQWDLTADKRYTLDKLARQMTRSLEEPLIITVYLTGNVPSSFRNYRSYIDYYLSELRRLNRDVRIEYRDPSEGNPKDVAEFRQFLSDQGIEPIRRQVRTEDELSQNLLYPYISLHNTRELIFVNLLEPQIPGRGEEEDLIISQIAFEGKFLRALRRMSNAKRKEVHVVGYRNNLVSEGYNRDPRLGGFKFVPSSADLLLEKRDSISAVLVILKKEDINRKELLALDVLGGKKIPIIWLIDKFDVVLDSLRTTGSHLALSRDFSVEDYLFSKGVRINPSLIMDLQSGRIPQVVSDAGSNTRTTMLQYPFHLLFIPTAKHPAETNISSPAAFYFASPLDTLSFPEGVKKRSIITTGAYTQVKQSPVPLDFGFLRLAPQAKEFNGGIQMIGVHIEGTVNAYFNNRLSKDDAQFLKGHRTIYPSGEQELSQVIISDADFALPTRGANGGYFPLGYNPAERFMYEGNAQLLSNLFESLIYGNDILKLSQKRTAIKLFDTPKYTEHSIYYQFILLGLPLILLTIAFGFFHGLRKIRYAS